MLLRFLRFVVASWSPLFAWLARKRFLFGGWLLVRVTAVAAVRLGVQPPCLCRPSLLCFVFSLLKRTCFSTQECCKTVETKKPSNRHALSWHSCCQPWKHLRCFKQFCNFKHFKRFNWAGGVRAPGGRSLPVNVFDETEMAHWASLPPVFSLLQTYVDPFEAERS